MRANEYIVTIDFGTHSIIGITGRVSALGTIEILAKEEELSNGAIRRGVIISPDDVEIALKKIVSRMNLTLHDKGIKMIHDVFVCLSGDSLRSELLTTSRYLSGEVFTQEDFDSLMEEGFSYPSKHGKVVDLQTTEFVLDGQIIANPLGKSGEELIAKQVLLIAKDRLLAPINDVFRKIQGVRLAGIVPSPFCNSSFLLTEAEKQLGSLLIDFGAGATSVSVFGKGRLEYFFTLPFGGNNITQDIMSIDVSFTEAERLKKRNGRAQMSHDDSKNKISTIRNHTGEAFVIDAIRLNALIEARMTEIIQNIKSRVDKNNSFNNRFSEGIVICGGASQLTDLQVLLKKFFGLEVRKASVSKHLSSDSIDNFSLQLEHSVGMGAILCAKDYDQREESIEPIVPEKATAKSKNEEKNAQEKQYGGLFEVVEQEEKEKVESKAGEEPEEKKPTPSKSKGSFFQRIKQALNEDNNVMQ